MKARFRISFRGGGNATAGSLEDFYELVQGDGIAPDDLIHDVLTGEWVPAKAHPVYWLCTDPLVVIGEGLGPDIDVGETHADPLFALAPVVVEPTREEAARDFVQQMAEERAADPDRPRALGEIEALGDVGVAATLAQKPSAVRAPEPVEVEVAVAPAPVDSAPGDPPRRDRPRHRWAAEYMTGRLSVVAVLLLGSAGLAGGVGLAWPGFGELSGPGDPGAPRSTVRSVTATEEELRAAAYEAFLVGVAELGEDLGIGSVPDVWLEGRYLADAAAFPSVSAYWMRYRDQVEIVRARAAGLYRAAYLEHLESNGIEGPVRSLRLAAAMSDFTLGRAARGVVYRRVVALADAALALHELSVSAAGRISYEPARANRVSADPVIEATGRDEEMQAALDAALDRVLKSLHGDENVVGPGRHGVATWLVEELGRM